MKPYKLIPALVFTILFIFACDTNEKNQITKTSDYAKYLRVDGNESLDFANKEIDFWQNKYNAAPNQKSYLGIIASKYATLFEYTGDIKNLYKTEDLLTQSNEANKYSRVATIRSLGRNYIAQHRFKEALDLANKALAIGEGRKETQKLLFDVQMELGNFAEADSNLNALKDMNDYDYLIRLAKWNDHKGDLKTAITFMEKARDIAEKEDNRTLKIWSYSNLGDFYGHAGRIQESYNSYLKTLAIDPNYSYALKGIAWIVFSYERNTKEAKRIVDAIEITHNTPDFHLLKSQIAQFEGNKVAALQSRNAYFAMLEKNNYGAMYNKYNTLIYADAKETAPVALEIAKIEVDHRPTPDSYDLLAWSYLNMGQKEKALAIAKKYVVGKSSEPKVQYHLAMIYKSNNEYQKVAPIKEELLSSIYELGPNLEKKGKSTINPAVKSFFTIALAFFGFASYCQIQKGIVVDEFGNAIENAYIVNTTSEAHAHTSELGLFSIDKSIVGNILKVTALGHKKANYTIVSSENRILLEEDIFRLDEIVIQQQLSALNVISKIDLETTPVNSSQEILRKVPGLFIGQHAGGGKAEQIFLRGFDIDHGTDIAISVDGMPVNMVSHAHGQGYADLHFVIPETVEKIDFGKGTYYASKGDFATAGYVAFQTKEKLEMSSISIEAGQFNTLRTVGLFNLLGNQKKQSAYIASEYILTDGPFDSPQNFNRVNLLGKYSAVLDDNSKFSLSASRFSSSWDASGQIPQRLVDNGTISRFGSVDDTEGGTTSRTNLNASLSKPIDENTFLKANAFYSKYDFELYSNFTFFLVDPINGDQIKQKEDRSIYGMNAELNRKVKSNDWDALFQLGVGYRADATIDTELSHTLNRSIILKNIKLGDIDETNAFMYLNSEFKFGKLTINPAVRLDYFKFNYKDKLAPIYKTQTESEVKISPKLNFIYSQNNNLQFFVKSGIGFHSNDARVVVQNNGKQVLPTAIGTDVGTIWKPFPRLIVNSALWYLYLQQEFVYVGDAGIIEPSGKTRRMGAEFGLRYQLNDYLYFDTDANYTYARSMEEPDGQNYIPLAPDFTSTGGLSFQKWYGLSGGLRYRYLKSRPANEDNSIVAKGYAVADFNINYEYQSVTFGMSIENLLNTKWNETQFATESRLKEERNSVEEIHFNPGTPFYIKAKITYQF